MRPVTLDKGEYRDRVQACWLGKNIGGTLGAPFEGQMKVLDLEYFDPVPTEAAANDDLDLQLVWLKMLEERGVTPRLADFADYWMKHLAPYPWDEYGFCLRNLSRGLRPPVSGWFENDFIDQMGSPIRSEIWACIAPGNPQLAAELAWKDAVLDHAGGEGVYGEMFLAALESAAFVESDPRALIHIGLQMIPGHCAIARSVSAALWCHTNGVPWGEARERILRRFGHSHPCHAPQNLAFIILGWLYGESFGDRLCKAVNCGYDTDCTGATLGSLLGILNGTEGIPAEWKDPVGDRIVFHKFTKGLSGPKTVSELTERTVVLAERLMAERGGTVEFGEKTSVRGNRLAGLSRNERARRMLERDYDATTLPASRNVEITLHYMGGPVIRPRLPKLVGVSVEREGHPISAKIELVAPKGWKVSLDGSCGTQALFTLSSDDVQDRNRLRVRFQTESEGGQADFTLLGPGEAAGVGPAVWVETCKGCGARVEACLCRS